VTAGTAFTVKVGAVDPSSADAAAVFSYRVDWGDGSAVVTVTGSADPLLGHTYRAAGRYTAVLSATDKDGGVGPSRSVTVLVAAAAVTPVTPTPTPTQPTPGTPTPTPTPPTPASPASPASPAPNGLPDTGANLGLPLWSAIALMLAGAAVLVGATRIRRSRRYPS
jgi:hypothetical protein